MSNLAFCPRADRLESISSGRTSSTEREIDPALPYIIALAGVRAQDRVTVIGHHLSDHLLGQARLGCRSASGVDPSCPCLSDEIGDVAWIVATGPLEGRIAGALMRTEGTRLIVVELTDCINPGRLQPLLEQLRAVGFVRQFYRRIARKAFVVAQQRNASSSAARIGRIPARWGQHIGEVL